MCRLKSPRNLYTDIKKKVEICESDIDIFDSMWHNAILNFKSDNMFSCELHGISEIESELAFLKLQEFEIKIVMHTNGMLKNYHKRLSKYTFEQGPIDIVFYKKGNQ